MVVQDVSNIDNYIACSIDVQSEIVVPIMKNNEFVAEIDIDSHAFAPFTNRDEELLETIASKVKELF
jgi:GAF domain-containing protein